MDRSDNPPRRESTPDSPRKARRASPLVFLIVLGGVALFIVLLSPLMKLREAPARSLAATGAKTGPVQPGWQRERPVATNADAGAP
jgi:hypothetical protein